jgi:lipoprotein-releasing system permease protein
MLEGFIAVRYLFAQKHRSVVNVISWISLVGLMVSTTALIIVLSVYNGIGDLTKGLFGTFDPELVIEPQEGKTFLLTDNLRQQVLSTEGVETLSCIATETAWMTYGDNQAIVKLRGVDDQYAAISGLDTLLYDGHYALQGGLVVGGQIFHDLGMHLPALRPAALHIPKRGSTAMGFSMDEAFNSGYAYPMGSFFIQQDIDRQYVIADIALVRQLMNYGPDECTQVALKLKAGADAQRVKKALSLIPSFSSLVIKDRYDQQPLYYKIFRTERIGIYLVLSLIVLISTLSLVASLSLLIISKRDDIFVLRSMGMEARRIRRAFLTEGLLICAIAVVAGLVLGFVICLLQQEFGIIPMGNGNFVVSAFPISMRLVDFVATFALVMVLSGLSVALTVRRAKI